MPSRNFHGKTKTGCVDCKARHVKCGEEKPTCLNCRRRGVKCVFPLVPTTSSPGSSSPSSSAAANARHNVPSLAFDGLDLTLMHHWTVSTSISLLPSDTACRAMQIDLPVKAQDNIVLHHGMLALSAMHLALSPAVNEDPLRATQLRARALQHQQAALPLFRGLLAEGDGADQQVIFLFSVMLVMLAFASTISADARPGLNEILDLFVLFRGPKSFWRDHAGGVNIPWITAMFPEDTSSCYNPVPGEETRFAELDKLSADAACEDAIKRLKFTTRCFWARPFDVKTAAWFPPLISEEFVVQLRDHRPVAMAILKAYAANTRPFHDRWWIGPFGNILDAAIEDIVLEEGLPALPDVGDLLNLGEMT